MSESRIKRKREKKKSWKKRIIYTVLLIVLIIAAVAGYLVYQVYSASKESYSGLDRPGEKSDLRDEKVTIGKDPISILLMGVEDYSTNGKNGRADTQIVVTLNPHTKKVTMTSIPRDTMVEMSKGAGDYAGTHKINAAYTYGSISGYGGDKLTVETVENLLEIPIDEYITVDFDGFRDIVDALGGVNIDIKEGFWEKNIYDHDKRIYFEQGPAKLGGEEALAFVRMRKRAVNNVYSRDERQRQFIKSAIDQAVSVGTIFKVGKISDILGEHVTTSLTPAEIYALQKQYSSIGANAIETYEIGGTDQTIDGSSYFIPSTEGLNETKEILNKELELTKSTAADSQ